MKRFIAVLAVAAGLAIPASATAAQGTGDCRQTANDTLTTLSTEGTRGDFMSDVIFGNEPNLTTAPAPPNDGPEQQEPGTQAGNVVPSQSPGPFVNTGANEPPRNDRTRGFGGDDVQPFLQVCN
jgi:hypothetical protein